MKKDESEPAPVTDLRGGATRLLLPTLGTAGERKGKFLAAVRKAAAGEFEILGELGRRPEGGVAYLARDLVHGRLVALRFELTPGSRHDYVLEVLKELDSSLPASGLGCPRCGEPLRGWGRFCPGCGHDLSGTSGSDLAGGAGGAGGSLDFVSRLAGDEYEVLGQMRRAEGGGMIYFARERGKDTIVGFRMKREEGKKEPGLDRTAVIPSLADETEDRMGTPGTVEETTEVMGGEAREAASPSAPSTRDRPAAAPAAGAREGSQERRQTLPARADMRLTWPVALLVIALAVALGLALGLMLS